jgi:hypothetical protein
MAAEIDPSQTAAILSELMTKFGMSLEGANKILDILSRSSRTAAVSVTSIKDSMSKMKIQVDKGTKSYKDLGPDIENYKRQIENLTDATERGAAMENLNALKKAAIPKLLLDSTLKVGATLLAGFYDYYKKQVIIGIKGLAGEGSAIQLAADLQIAKIEAVASTTTNVIGALQGLSVGLIAFGGPLGILAGGLLGVGSTIAQFITKEVSEAAKLRIELLSKELDKSFKSFQQATAAGALFAGGMTELREVSGRAGLKQEQLTAVIANSSEALAQFGGDVTSGVKKLGAVVGEFGKGARTQLLKLGISVEDQTQGVADYMAMLQQTGSLKGKTDAELAAGSKDYMVNLKAISSFTGEDVKKASARAKDAAMQGAVAAKLAKMGPEATTKFQNAIRNLSPELQKAAMQMFVTGTATGEAAVALAQMPAMTELLGKSLYDVSDSTVTTDEALNNYQNNVKTLGPLLKEQGEAASEALGLVALMLGKFEAATKMTVDGMILGRKGLEQGTGTTLDKAKGLANTPDELLNGVIRGVSEYQDAQVEYQQMMTNAITKFANDVPNILEGMVAKLRKLGILDDPGTTGKNKSVTQFGETEGGAAFGNPYIGRQGVIQGKGKADGGISVGPLSGYLEKLHGTEAVVPLPDGKNIPVVMSQNNSSDIMQDLLSKQLSLLQEMLSSFNDSKQLQQQLVHNSY